MPVNNYLTLFHFYNNNIFEPCPWALLNIKTLKLSYTGIYYYDPVVILPGPKFQHDLGDPQHNAIIIIIMEDYYTYRSFNIACIIDTDIDTDSISVYG